jgi:homoserine kinase
MSAIASAPASSANVGPGFDVLAIGFEMRCRVEAMPADRWSVTEEGTSYEPDPQSLVVQAAAIAGDRPLAIDITNNIPRTRGLGSSAALSTAVAAAALRANEIEPTSGQLLDFVGDLEGHYDNAAAAVHGGCVVSAFGVFRRLEVAPDLVFIAAIPDTVLSTPRAREVLAPQVDRNLVARSLARIVFLVEGLRTGSADAFAAAMGDELHEGPRSELSPVTGALMAAAYGSGALHAAWSGAGPSALAISHRDKVEPVRTALADVLGGDGTVAIMEVAETGWT